MKCIIYHSVARSYALLFICFTGDRFCSSHVLCSAIHTISRLDCRLLTQMSSDFYSSRSRSGSAQLDDCHDNLRPLTLLTGQCGPMLLAGPGCSPVRAPSHQPPSNHYRTLILLLYCKLTRFLNCWCRCDYCRALPIIRCLCRASTVQAFELNKLKLNPVSSLNLIVLIKVLVNALYLFKLCSLWDSINVHFLSYHYNCLVLNSC